MSDAVLTLGDFEFADFEVPDVLRGLGGEQIFIIHQLPGGDRVFDAMGPVDGPVSWGGRFRGADALSRARQVDVIRRAGQSVSLSFGDVLLTVVVQRFEYQIERLYEVPYSITCEVLDDQSGTSETGIDEMVAGDDQTLMGLGADIGDGPLSGLLGSVDGAISQVRAFASATQTQIASVLDPIRSAQARVSSLIGTAESAISGSVSYGATGSDLLLAPIQQVTSNARAAANATQGALADLFGGI